MANDLVLNSSLESLEKRLDRLEFLVGQTDGKHTLSHHVDSLVLDVNDLARTHPEVGHVDQLMKKSGLSNVYTKDLANEEIYGLVEARIERLGGITDQLTRMKILGLPAIDQIAGDPNPGGVDSAVQAYERASIRSVELLSTWLNTVQHANTIAGNSEAQLRTAAKP